MKLISAALLLVITSSALAGPVCLTNTVLVVEPIGNKCPPGSHIVSY